MSEYQIQHQSEEGLFFVELDEGQRAYLKYRLSGPESSVSQVDIEKTFVPENYRSKGLAAQLVQHSFDWADAQELFVTSSCWYASKKLKQRQSLSLK